MTDAIAAQVRAARPDASSWVAANAGSGKTRVLTDRVARLLLAGTEPQRILCLTYTKAAAAEMQNRLFRTLGAWAMLDDADLRAALRALGEPGETHPARPARPRPHPLRPGARDPGRPAHPDDPRLLREPAAPLPARGRRRAAVRACSTTARRGRCASRCSTRSATAERAAFAAVVALPRRHRPRPAAARDRPAPRGLRRRLRPRRPRRGARRRARPDARAAARRDRRRRTTRRCSPRCVADPRRQRPERPQGRRRRSPRRSRAADAGQPARAARGRAADRVRRRQPVHRQGRPLPDQGGARRPTPASAPGSTR